MTDCNLSKILGHIESKGETFELRCVSSEQDFENIVPLLQEAEFNPGPENLRLYWHSSGKSGWVMALDQQGSVAAIAIWNVMPNKLNYGYATVVSPNHRGKGLGKLLFNLQIKAGGSTYGNASLDSIKRISFNAWHFKVVHFTGIAHVSNLQPPAHSSDFTVQALSGRYVQPLLAYDKCIIGIDRGYFTEQWTTALPQQPRSIYQGVLIAVNERNNIVGYGCLRTYGGITSMMPVYADSDLIAYKIMYTLIGNAPRQMVYLGFPAHQRLSYWFAKQLGSIQWSSEYRNFNDTNGTYIAFDKTLAVQKAYAVHDFWPI